MRFCSHIYMILWQKKKYKKILTLRSKKISRKLNHRTEIQTKITTKEEKWNSTQFSFGLKIREKRPRIFNVYQARYELYDCSNKNNTRLNEISYIYNSRRDSTSFHFNIPKKKMYCLYLVANERKKNFLRLIWLREIEWNRMFEYERDGCIERYTTTIEMIPTTTIPTQTHTQTKTWINLHIHTDRACRRIRKNISINEYELGILAKKCTVINALPNHTMLWRDGGNEHERANERTNERITSNNNFCMIWFCVCMWIFFIYIYIHIWGKKWWITTTTNPLVVKREQNASSK